MRDKLGNSYIMWIASFLGAAIKQLHKRYRDIAAKFQRKEDELEEAIAFISGFNSNTRQLKIWMNDMLGHLEVKDTSVKVTKAICILAIEWFSVINKLCYL